MLNNVRFALLSVLIYQPPSSIEFVDVVELMNITPRPRNFKAPGPFYRIQHNLRTVFQDGLLRQTK
jgi:hypothetical protein